MYYAPSLPRYLHICTEMLSCVRYLNYWTHSICQEDPCDGLMGILSSILVFYDLGDEESRELLSYMNSRFI